MVTSARPSLRLAALLGALLVWLCPVAPSSANPAPPGPQAGMSAWSRGLHAQMRLVDAGPIEGVPGDYRAGVELWLDPHFKTYWRTVGDSGLPPVFDWSKSQNVNAVEVAWPAPVRFEDTAGSSIGYTGTVMLPVRVTAADPNRPVTLALHIDYAVCEKICVPERGEARLALAEAGSSTPVAVADALTRVPAPAAIGDPGAPAIRAVQAAASGGALFVDAVVQAHAAIVDIFAEGPDGWAFGGPLAIATLADGPGRRLVRYQIVVDAAPAGGTLADLPITLTMTADDVAIEASTRLR